jgi:hypothetical protein
MNLTNDELINLARSTSKLNAKSTVRRAVEELVIRRGKDMTPMPAFEGAEDYGAKRDG